MGNGDGDTNTPTQELTSTEPALMAAMGDGHIIESDGVRGMAKMGFTCKPEMCHSGGVAQGGFVTGWLDSAMAHACIARYTSDYWIATLEGKVSFFRPTPPGPVVAEGWIERAGKQTVFAEARLLNTDGDVLAKASSSIRLVPNKVR